MSIESNKELYDKILKSINDTDVTEEENTQFSKFNVSIPNIIQHECYCSGSHITDKLVTVSVNGYSSGFIQSFENGFTPPWTDVIISKPYDNFTVCDDLTSIDFGGASNFIGSYSVWVEGGGNYYQETYIEYYLSYDEGLTSIAVSAFITCGDSDGATKTVLRNATVVPLDAYGLPNGTVIFGDPVPSAGFSDCILAEPSLRFFSHPPLNELECLPPIGDPEDPVDPGGDDGEGYFECDMPLFGFGGSVFEDDLGSYFYYYDVVVGEVAYKCTGSFHYEAPSFISVRPNAYGPSWGVGYTGLDFYIAAGTSIDYEVYGTGDTSTTFTITGYCEDGCSGSFDIVLLDTNDEGPVIVNKNISLSLCSGAFRPNVTGISITDGDVYTSANRLTSAFLQGRDARYFSLNSYSFTAPTSVLLSVDTRVFTFIPDGQLQTNIIVTTYDSITNTFYSDTGTITVDLIQKSDTVINQYNMITTIPEGLYSTPTNFITIAHRIVRDDSDINDSLGCARRCEINSTLPYKDSGLYYISSPYSNHRNDLSVMRNSSLDSFLNGNRISGSARISFNASNNPDEDVCCGNDYCCGVNSINVLDIINIGPTLSPFVTGIGEPIPFTGGIGNVEDSYFEPLGDSKIILVPGIIALETPPSNDDYFYIYTYGNSSYSGIKHPTATTLHEVVGSAQWSSIDNYILCRYVSNPDAFFVYNLTTSSWNSVQPFGANSDVMRVIKLERHDGLYFIVGDGEYKVFNVVNFTLTDVDDITTKSIVLPQAIALVPDAKQKSCEWIVNNSEDMLKYLNRYHIFALNHHYTASPFNNYPLILDVSTLTPTLQHGIDVVGNSTHGTTYLHSYLNYRTDVATAADKMVISLSNTGTLRSEAFIQDNTTNQSFSIYSLGSEKRRVTTLINDQVLWSSYSAVGQSVVIDPFLLTAFSFPNPLFASISVAASCENEFRTLMLDSSGTKGYILNDLDRTYETISFTGLLPMGKYHDIIVLEELLSSVKQSRNFYMMPTEIYGLGSPTENLAVISTTTTGPTAINITGPFTINETVLAFEPIQTTISRTEIGRFTTVGNDDEFSSSVTVGFDASLGDADIFEVDVVNGTSGIIYVKAGVALDFETRSLYTGYITGVDPYVGGPPFIDSFVLRVLNVDEKPTDIILDISSRELSIAGSTSVATFLTNFTVIDNETLGNNNVVSLAGPDAHIFSVIYTNENNSGQLWLKAGINFDLSIQNQFQVTLLVAKFGESFTASADFVLTVIDNPPIAVSLDYTVTGIVENYIIPSNLKLTSFHLIDNDSFYGNYVQLTGPDSSFFNVSYDVTINSGELTLRAGSRFDYETKSTITGTVSAGNVAGVYSASNRFIINVIDIYEPTGIRVSPNVVFVREDINTTSSSIKLADLTWDVPTITGPMVIYDITYPDGGYRSALDLFTILDNSTVSPEIHLKQFAVLDYETQSTYYVWVSGRQENNSTNLYGGQLIVFVQDVDEPPIINLSPSGLTIPETHNTSLGSFKVSDVFVFDEKLSTVTVSLSGVDSQYFVLDIDEQLNNSSTSIDVADLYFKSGVVLNSSIKNTYTVIIVATDEQGLIGVRNFILSLSDVAQCELDIQEDITNIDCLGSSDGRISLNISYTGTNTDDIETCNNESPISVEWINVPDAESIKLDGLIVENLSVGTYEGIIYGGNRPLSGISYTINSNSNLQLLQTIKDNSSCSSFGTLTVIWSGGVPPYSVTYGNSREFVSDGDGFRVSLDVFEPITESPVVEDSLGCVSSGAVISFDFTFSSFTYESQSPPIIYDDTLESFQFEVSHGSGPYQINLYHTTTGEKGELAQSFDRFDTSIINRLDKLNNIITDDDGNQSVRTYNANPEIYYYDFKNKTYPGTYLFEFVNADGCSFMSDVQTLFNIEPMTAEIIVNNDNPVDKSFYTISQPILETLFIPYRMLKNNENLLAYLSNLTEKSDINFDVGGLIYSRKVLDGSISCQIYSVLNIKFLGVHETDWFYTLSFYKGFDLTDADIDILNEQIHLVLPGGDKIKIVTELNNNINTIKLLKGSILTTDPNTSQYKNGMEIKLFNYNNDIGDFLPMDVTAVIISTSYLYNKYTPGNIFRINFLDSLNVSQNITTPDFEASIDLQQMGFSFKGLWSASSAYFIDDVVEHGGNLYVSLVDFTTLCPFGYVPENWFCCPNNIASAATEGLCLDTETIFDPTSYPEGWRLLTPQDIFSCSTNINQSLILTNRNFLIALNSFGLFDSLYSKASNYFDHDGYISVVPIGGYAEYIMEYYYYDKNNKCLSRLFYNNQNLLELDANNLIEGVYILKLRDIYGNKLQSINNTPYDSFYIASLDFILNELKSTTNLLNFEYGDVIINLFNLAKDPNPGVSIPAVQPQQPDPLPPPIPPIVITTDTYQISPNTEYQNIVTIQTSPGKIPYTVTGPYGYHKKFYDRSILLQLPPGVYNIEGDSDSLRTNYLYQQKQKINVDQKTNVFVNLSFESYENKVIIQENCEYI